MDEPALMPRLQMTAAEFEKFILLPENADKRLEFFNGEAWELPPHWYGSVVGVRLAGHVFEYVHERSLGFMTSAGGGYRVGAAYYVPNAAYVSYQRYADELLFDTYWVPVAPDWAMVTIPPNNNLSEIDVAVKLANYLAAGTTVWILQIAAQQVAVFEPQQAPQLYAKGDIISGGRVLPDLQIEVNKLFRD